MTNQLARAALWYARHGWTVFPLRPYTKEPFAGIGLYAGTTDEAQICAWWTEHPRANIGLHCGGCNLLALDLDTYKDTYEGNGCLTRADEETLTSITGSGGTHLIYAVEDGRRYTNKRGALPPGIDVRGWGGYVVLPPSIHPNGRAYAWEDGYRPNEIEAALLPHSLMQILEMARIPDRLAGPPDDFAVAMSLKLVESMLRTMNIKIYSEEVYERTGRKLKLTPCPFAPKENPHADDHAAFVTVAPDGHIAAGCPHERCRNRQADERQWGWQWLLHERMAEYRVKETA